MTIALTFPDGAVREFADGTTPREVAQSLSPSLAKKAVIAKVDGAFFDYDRPLESGATLEFLTRDDPAVLEVIRHDASHVMAEAVQELFPGTQVTIGPAIEDGFYYDFARETPFSLDDLPRIEAKMHEIVARGERIVREVMPRDAAIAEFERMGEHYKAEIIRDLPEAETITVYHQGAWKDLCRGPHLPSTRFVGKAFKLTKLAGAYWRGDSNNAQLQRIYGTAWATPEDLAAHLHRIEEAERRDHRRIGRATDLFHMQEEGRGMVFWHRKGWTLWRTLEAYMRRRLDAAGYGEVKTPQVLDRSFWEASGHWEKYRPNMFVCETVEGEVLSLKPMNCPGHVQIFNSGQKSYRDLPIRMAEFGACHRYEPSGALHGLMRVRGFVQDDAHIFCREDQIVEETRRFVELTRSVHADLGMHTHRVDLATRPEIRAGSDAFWDKAEAMLGEAARQAGVEAGHRRGRRRLLRAQARLHRARRDRPRVDLRHAAARLRAARAAGRGVRGRGRVQAAPRHAAPGDPRQLRALHRHPDRELCGGLSPVALAPVQVVVATITNDADDYAREAAAAFERQGLRVELDLRNEKINYKVREHSLAKTPVIAVVGRREAEERRVALRRLGSDRQQVLGLDEACATLAEEALAPDLARAAEPERMAAE